MIDKKKDTSCEDCADIKGASTLAHAIIHTGKIGLFNDIFHWAYEEVLKLLSDLIDVLLTKADDSTVVDDNVREKSVGAIVLVCLLVCNISFGSSSLCAP